MTQTLPLIERETAPAPTLTVIWLHGLGADGNDFVPIIPELKLPADAAVRFIFPTAPQIPVTINGGYVMRAWYDITGAELTRRAAEERRRQIEMAAERDAAEHEADAPRR